MTQYETDTNYSSAVWQDRRWFRAWRWLVRQEFQVEGAPEGDAFYAVQTGRAWSKVSAQEMVRLVSQP